MRSEWYQLTEHNQPQVSEAKKTRRFSGVMAQGGGPVFRVYGCKMSILLLAESLLQLFGIDRGPIGMGIILWW